MDFAKVCIRMLSDLAAAWCLAREPLMSGWARLRSWFFSLFFFFSFRFSFPVCCAG
jgi:hypothetical protein